MIAQSEHAKCLTPECGGMRSVRGLCQACYHSARRMIGERCRPPAIESRNSARP